MIIFYQISGNTLQMKFNKQEWAKRSNFVSYEIRNHKSKACLKAGILWEMTILWQSYSDSQYNSQFYESWAYSKCMQIIVRTNILPNTSRINDPSPSFAKLLQRSMDSDNNYKACDANVPPLWNQLTYLHSAEEELTSLMRASWNLTWRTEAADNCSDSSIL